MSAGRRPTAAITAALLALAGGNACGGEQSAPGPFRIGAVPDQDPERLHRLYGTLSEYLEQRLEVPVEYEPVTDYAAAVTAFRVGDLDMVWFGGLTGVQARLQVEGARAIVQRRIDEQFHSVFIANEKAGIAPFDSLSGLGALAGRTFTFGSQNSTSGRLMPQYYLDRAGVGLDDFEGEPGFSGSHDRTIALVESGSYEAGALNEQVWRARVWEGAVDTSRVHPLWRTPAYYDYHWVVRPDVEERFGDGFVDRVQETFLAVDDDTERERQILEMFGAEEFIPTRNSNYEQIEQVARRIGKVR